jgi:hypothetical protein
MKNRSDLLARRLFEWLTDRVEDGYGPVRFSLGSGPEGHIGVFLPGEKRACGVGESAAEALYRAMEARPTKPCGCLAEEPRGAE